MKIIVFLLSLSLMSFSIFCANSRHSSVENIEQVNDSMETTIKIVGRVQIYGNVPHTYAGIVDENDNLYAVYPKSQEEELRKLQGHLIEFTVILLDKPRGYGSLFLKGGKTVIPVSWEIIQ